MMRRNRLVMWPSADQISILEHFSHDYGTKRGTAQNPDFVPGNKIGDDQLRNALEKFKGPAMSAEPVFQSLAPGGFRVGVVAGAQDSDKDESRTVRAALGIVEGDGVPGVIHEELFAGLVLVAQHHVQMAAPAMIELAETAVAIAVGAALAAFLPYDL